MKFHDFKVLKRTKIEKIVRELHYFAFHGAVSYRDPFSTNFIYNPTFLGILNSLVASISQSESPFEKLTFQVNVTRFENNCPNNPTKKGMEVSLLKEFNETVQFKTLSRTFK
ncbi:hypothetical protein PanWU01x14_123040 [Parasponia andersonii]|uniref:Uncharacterized protein n=1 Tax=Parasponia andersonii TaxID=3476 RepID=A0A2P5CU67_PARAD|nr:hypothetical protein PanWU01x14_123040 [Parasponia andersonii]